MTLFITTTVLDFVHAFRREEMRDAMAYHLARECKLAGVALYGFVVMPHHTHMVVRLGPKLAGPDFMRRFKAKGERMFWQKMAYLHANPVKAGYVERAEDYRWSSARFISGGLWSDESGLDYNEVMDSLGTWEADRVRPDSERAEA